MKKNNLECLLKNEFFITCQPLSTDRFVSYCKERGIYTSRDQLEQFEKLGIFYPIARIKYPQLRIKVEYIDDGKRYRDLGVLEDGEEWSGDIRETYAHFWFEKEYALNWFNEKLLWEPSSRPFKSWKTFNDKEGYTQIESYYSIFQCYALYHLINRTTFKIRTEWWTTYNKKELIDNISNRTKSVILNYKKNGIRSEAATFLCQLISNRYYPKTQTDQRSIVLSRPGHYHDWDWYRYCRNWDAKNVLKLTGINEDELKQLHELVSMDAQYTDPLENWYELVNFISVEKKKKLKGKALLAQTLYSMEHMLRLFHEELTGNKLYTPYESPLYTSEKFYGEGVTENKLQYLEFITNNFHLNPKPKLILLVEGKGEYEQVPLIAKNLLGHSFSRSGIEIMNIEGVGNFTGKKGSDRYGAFEKFIDNYHDRQTIVFLILDNEGRVATIKDRLVNKPSKHFPKRTVTKKEYIHIWNRSIEFDNFTHEEIALSMTELCGEKYCFQETEIAGCQESFKKKSDPLSRLFEEKVNYAMPKTKLLNILLNKIYLSPEKEFKDGNPKRPIVKLVHKVIKLAARNHQPVMLNTWKKNQESGYLGDIINNPNQEVGNSDE